MSHRSSGSSTIVVSSCKPHSNVSGWRGEAQCAKRSVRWCRGVKVVALDLTDTYRSGLSPHLSHAKAVADPFHVIRVAKRTLVLVRRRVQNETLGHRGRKDDPLFRIRKLLLKGEERLDERGREKLLAGLRVGDPKDELLGAWLAKEAVRTIYLVDTWPLRRRCLTTPSTPAGATRFLRSGRWVARSPTGAARS
ncbi:MAG: transposase [Actinomycetota bacterium]|nr:transposase [Actinomycetota bacterium]